MFKFLYRCLCVLVTVAATVLLTVVVIEKGKDFVDIYRQRPVIVRQQYIERPTTLEAEMAEMLGFYQMRFKQLVSTVNNQAKEIQRFETRVKQLEDFISENKLPTPAEPQTPIQVFIR